MTLLLIPIAHLSPALHHQSSSFYTHIQAFFSPIAFYSFNSSRCEKSLSWSCFIIFQPLSPSFLDHCLHFFSHSRFPSMSSLNRQIAASFACLSIFLFFLFFNCFIVAYYMCTVDSLIGWGYSYVVLLSNYTPFTCYMLSIPFEFFFIAIDAISVLTLLPRSISSGHSCLHDTIQNDPASFSLLMLCFFHYKLVQLRVLVDDPQRASELLPSAPTAINAQTAFYSNK